MMYICHKHFSTAKGGPRSRRQRKKPALLSSITRNQRRGVKDNPEGSHTPSKPSRKALIEIELEINPVDLPEQRIRDTRSDIIVKNIFMQQLQALSEQKVSI